MSFLSVGQSVLITASALILVPSAVLLLETLWAFLPKRSRVNAGDAPFIVLVPSHDEELHIGATAAHLLAEISPADRLIVIADNCTDATAQIAADQGAEVLVRTDTKARGKSHALAYALQKIAEDSRQIVLIVDADCRVSQGALRQLADQVDKTQAPAQAMYLFQKGEQGGDTQALSAFSLHFRNQIRPLGQSRIGLPCQLLGSGMAFRREALSDVHVNNLALAEDTQLGIDLVLAGHAPYYCETAVVTTLVPQREESHVGQRTRWEHGYLMSMLTQIPRLLLASVKQRSAIPLWVALDMSVPPLAFLLLSWAAVMAVSTAWWAQAQQTLPMTLSALAGGCFGFAMFIGWMGFCREAVPIQHLAGIPLYVARKLPIYFSFIWNRQRSWLRTDRDQFTPTVQNGE